MKLKSELLEDNNIPSDLSDYKSCFAARGLYDTMQFVLRLRPDLHKKLENIPIGAFCTNTVGDEEFQAFSTYLHETIHWWQHVGSTSGLILSLSYPAQSHINFLHLAKYLQYTGPIKSIHKYNSLYATEYMPSTEEFKEINIILNNYHDIEFFKHFTINPSNARLMNSILKDPFFESIGHIYHIAYSSFINILSSTFDPNLEFLPDARRWTTEFERLKSEKFTRYYHGESSIGIPPIGLKELYEGQARFSQLQYLYFGSNEKLTWQEFEEMGMLSGIYHKAFLFFLENTESQRPASIDDPLIALYLLALDLSINPTDGFPFDIFSHEVFIESTDPGIRFMMLCSAIKNRLPWLKNFITDYSSKQYYEAGEALSKDIACLSPLRAAQEFRDWSEQIPAIKNLMQEEEGFNFEPMNQPIRLMFSRFIRYQQDKLKFPAFFCWPGVYMAGPKCTEKSMKLFLEHQALFSDKADGDIYPRTFPDKPQKNVQKAFTDFYAWIVTYDLCRQWIAQDGEFEFDYFWLTSKYSREDLKAWAKHYFNQCYGVEIEDFKVT